MAYKVIQRQGDQLLEIPGSRHDHHRFFMLLQLLLVPLAIAFLVCDNAQRIGPGPQPASAGSPDIALMCVGILVLGLILLELELAYALAWELHGRETITLRRGGFTRSLSPHPLFRAVTAYSADKVRNLRVNYIDHSTYSPRRQIDSALYAIGSLPGSVVFEYEGRNRQLGNGLTESEAREVVQLMIADLHHTSDSRGNEAGA